MKSRKKLIYIQISLMVTWLIFSACSPHYDIGEYEVNASLPEIFPDYMDLVVPPNIAPMNFTIKEKGEKFVVKIFSDSIKIVEIHSASPHIKIPKEAWQNLLANSSRKIHYDVFVHDGVWTKYKRFTNSIATEPIDRYVVYRFLRPNYTVQKEMNIRQRDLQTFDESLIMTTKTIAGCINCHSFNQNDPSDMLFHIRWGEAAGTIFAQDGNITKVDTRTEFNQSPGAYPSWHPSGKIAAFSVNKVQQFFHAAGASRDVIDLTSDLIIYKTDSKTVDVNAKISGPDFMETFPNWSPDGRYLYFCRAPQLEADFDLDNEYRTIKYDLMRIAYNPETDEWGELETLVSASDSGLSCSMPRVSPDGRFLLFCMAEYGNFPIFHASADLYVMDLETKEYSRLQANSDAPEGFHSWSSNSRWIVFTSKRDNGVFTRLYFSYVDSLGVAHKPFILPLREPEDYETIFMAFSVPELIKKPVPYRPQQFINVAFDAENAQKARLAPNATLFPKPVIGESETATDFP